MGWLKDFDIFKVGIFTALRFERHNYLKNRTKFMGSLGSYIGGLISICVMAFFASYVVILISQMESGDIDQIKSTIMNNRIDDESGYNNIQIKNYKFMPIIELYFFKDWFSLEHIDIWKGDPKN